MNLKYKESHIPFIPNYDNESPMHLLKKNDDFRTMDLVLHYLSGYKLDHHSREIVDMLPIMLKQDMPHLHSYLDSRLC